MKLQRWVKIKLTEAITHTDTATGGNHVKDSHVVSLMRYYELIKELENVHKNIVTRGLVLKKPIQYD